MPRALEQAPCIDGLHPRSSYGDGLPKILSRAWPISCYDLVDGLLRSVDRLVYWSMLLAHRGPNTMYYLQSQRHPGIRNIKNMSHI
jgi:hypothetical protein